MGSISVYQEGNRFDGCGRMNALQLQTLSNPWPTAAMHFALFLPLPSSTQVAPTMVIAGAAAADPDADISSAVCGVAGTGTDANDPLATASLSDRWAAAVVAAEQAHQEGGRGVIARNGGRGSMRVGCPAEVVHTVDWKAVLGMGNLP